MNGTNVSPRRDFLKMTALGGTAALFNGCQHSGFGALESSAAGGRPASRREARVFDSLREYLEQLTIIDAHEHLFPERERNARTVDALTLLHNYEAYDLASAGFGYESEGVNTGAFLLDQSIPLRERWRRIAPHFENIRHGSYFRAAQIGLRDLHGIVRLDADSLEEASRRMQAANKPGYYHAVLRERCRIETCLVQNGYAGGQDPPELFRPVIMAHKLHYMLTREGVLEAGREFGIELLDLRDYLAVVDRRMEQYRTAGGVGMKTWIRPWIATSEAGARTDFSGLLGGQPSTALLEQFVFEHCLARCAEWDWPVAVHTGVWWDFRTYDVRHCLDLVTRYPGVRFDIYHLGIPAPVDAMLIAKNFKNAHLNLCWTYLVSEHLTGQALQVLLDMVPVNKVFGFGGDLLLALESVYGHLVMAREILARAFSTRVIAGRLDEDEARRILALWMYENPRRFYKLDQRARPDALARAPVGGHALPSLQDPGCACLHLDELRK